MNIFVQQIIILRYLLIEGVLRRTFVLKLLNMYTLQYEYVSVLLCITHPYFSGDLPNNFIG